MSRDEKLKWIGRNGERLERDIRESIPLLERLGDAVLFLGGHRLSQGHPLLEVAAEAASLLCEAGYVLRVGRDDGVARSLAKGARHVSAHAEIQGLLLETHYSATSSGGKPTPGLKIYQRVSDPAAHRWILLTRAAAIVALPGGLGTIELLFAALGDVARGSTRRRPVVLVGSDFWEPFIDQLAVADQGSFALIQQEHLQHVVIVENANDLYDAIEDILPLKVGHTDGDEAMHFAAGGRVIAPLHARMVTPPGPSLAPWMLGEIREGSFQLSQDYAGRGQDDQLLVDRFIKGQARDQIAQKNISLAYLGWALRGRVGHQELERLIDKGAGPHAIAFLYFMAPYAHYRRPAVLARRILDRWGVHAEPLFERLNILARSRGLTNPDALKSWVMGIASRDLGAEGFAVMIIDAVDLLEAGHEIALEEAAGGRGDIIDLTERVVYQHKRVRGRSLGQHIKKAVRQLCGWEGTEGAPDGFMGVAQIDVRNNHHYGRFSKAMIEDLVQSLEIESTDRLDRIQILLDDRLFIFDAALKLVRVERSAPT